MKKIILSLAGVLLVGAVAVNAQVTQDTTGTRSQQSVSPATQGTQPGTQRQGQSDYRRDMTEVQSSDIPASLRSTLQSSEYKGWENGKIYRNRSNEYMIEMSGDGTTNKTYRFDKNGKRMGNTSSSGVPEKK